MAMIAIDQQRLVFVRGLDKVFHVRVADVSGVFDMRCAVGTGIANIDDNQIVIFYELFPLFDVDRLECHFLLLRFRAGAEINRWIAEIDYDRLAAICRFEKGAAEKNDRAWVPLETILTGDSENSRTSFSQTRKRIDFTIRPRPQDWRVVYSGDCSEINRALGFQNSTEFEISIALHTFGING